MPQPTGAMSDAVTLVDERRLDVPGTVVCTAFSAADHRSHAEQGMSFLAGADDVGVAVTEDRAHLAGGQVEDGRYW